MGSFAEPDCSGAWLTPLPLPEEGAGVAMAPDEGEVRRRAPHLVY
jgi:hypothetical protein